MRNDLPRVQSNTRWSLSALGTLAKKYRHIRLMSEPIIELIQAAIS